ncbi:hypothetical protein BC832DRAFT_543434 [Gaertneriomyces semiglobifer]|nr:hypothetical protein BC832DRAFT_543434 [Gaertneriomyces semiglobifer]
MQSKVVIHHDGSIYGPVSPMPYGKLCAALKIPFEQRPMAKNIRDGNEMSDIDRDTILPAGTWEITIGANRDDGPPADNPNQTLACAKPPGIISSVEPEMQSSITRELPESGKAADLARLLEHIRQIPARYFRHSPRLASLLSGIWDDVEALRDAMQAPDQLERATLEVIYMDRIEGTLMQLHHEAWNGPRAFYSMLQAKGLNGNHGAAERTWLWKRVCGRREGIVDGCVRNPALVRRRIGFIPARVETDSIPLIRRAVGHAGVTRRSEDLRQLVIDVLLELGVWRDSDLSVVIRTVAGVIGASREVQQKLGRELGLDVVYNFHDS